MHPLSAGDAREPLSDALVHALATCGGRATRELVRDVAVADPDLLLHGAAVARLAVAIARRVGFVGERLVILCRAALLHDVGKRYVPRAILDKPSPLLAHERQLVEAHPVVGATMLLGAGLLAEAAIVRHHHERWDGRGYADRLHGEAIPLESRIISAADAYDAMTSDRPYRHALPRDEALAEIGRCAGSQLDPDCAIALCAVLEQEALAA
jgi:putative nucleotidyltransferase with HDIG domain